MDIGKKVLEEKTWTNDNRPSSFPPFFSLLKTAKVLPYRLFISTDVTRVPILLAERYDLAPLVECDDLTEWARLYFPLIAFATIPNVTKCSKETGREGV